jgi:epoxyqueuosine reductase
MCLTERLKDKAREVGFDLAGACPAITPAGIHQFFDWLDRGYAGEMSYLNRRRTAYEHPRSVLPGARSLLLLARNYHTAPPVEPELGSGRVSRYAWGSVDYHDSIHAQLKQLVAFLQQQVPGSHSRGVVDTAPLLEREFAQLAGLGWQGKNTMLIHPQLGSWLFLAALITDVVLDYDPPFSADHCGSCRACLDICPTDAFPRPYVLDASRCISYLTIELRSAIPRDERRSMGNWVFGCDLCQEVCPWNQRSPRAATADFEPRNDLRPLDLLALFQWDDAHFRRTFRDTPLWRAKRRGLLRNAAIVLGNAVGQGGALRAQTVGVHVAAADSPIPIEDVAAALTRGLRDAEPLVRGACAWALGQLRTASARVQLVQQLLLESDPAVREEIQLVLEQAAP